MAENGTTAKRVAVLGGGVIGVVTAYFLARDGHHVTLLDRQPGVALETSFANGGQISVSHTDPWASPANLMKVLGWLGKADAPLRLRPSLDPMLLRFGWHFLRYCTEERARTNAERMLRIARYSQSVLQTLKTDIGGSFDGSQTGILHVFRDPQQYERALDQAEHITSLGCPRVPISKSRALEIEPALADALPSLAGVIYAVSDESGDAHRFTKALAEAATEAGVDFRLGAEIVGLEVSGGQVRHVRTTQSEFAVDAVVVALGSYSPLLLKPLGIKLPVYPAKGYSVTLDVRGGDNAPVTALIDDERKLVYSRLGDRLRVAGLAETAGYDTAIDPARASLVLDGAMSLFPKPGDVSNPVYWTGLRPQTPDSVPVLGATPIGGLYLNTGHGTLGWTMAAGSGRAIADLVGGRNPAIDLDGLTMQRFL